MKAAEFAQQAIEWIGIPYHHQGRSRVGVDCVGLPLAIAEEAGVLPADVRPRMNYGRRPMEALVEELDKYCTLTDEPKPGVMVSMRWGRQADKLAAHLAIITPPHDPRDKDLWIVHAHMRVGKVVWNPLTGIWLRRVAHYWQLPGIDYE